MDNTVKLRKKLLYLGVAASVVGIALPAAAEAQDAGTTDEQQVNGSAAAAESPSASQPQSGAEGAGLADIVVTAQKRSQTAQSVAAAVVALDGADLQSRGINDPRQLSELVPSTRFEALRSQVRVTVRGVGQANSGPNADPAVSTNLNGVYQLNDMTGAAFFDIDRVEVLPGPQGTLYGRNAAGGTVNIYTRRPGSNFGANGSVEVGNYGTVNVDGGVDLPISTGFALRAAGSYQRHDGYLSNGTDDRDVAAGRLTAVIRPTDRLSAVIIGSYTHFGGLGDQSVKTPAVPDPDRPYYYPYSKDRLFNRDNIYTVSAEVNYDLTNDITLTYVGGYDHFNRHQFLNLDNPPPPLAPQTQDIRQSGTFWSHEGRIAGKTGNLNWIAGIYYYDSDQFYGNIVDIPLAGITVTQTPIYVHSKGIAGFGQVTYSITNALRLTGGLRYSDDKKTGSGDYQLTRGGTTTDAPFAGSLHDGRLDWKVGAEADVAPNSLAYASVQTGYNQGGFSFVPKDVDGNIFKPEKLTAYTVGIKNRFADRRVLLNVEAYYYDYNNYQVSARNLGTGVNVIYNAQKATIYGLQFDTAFEISHQDHLTFNAGLLHAEETKLILPASAGGTDYSGNDLPGAPALTLSASYAHDFELGSGATLTPKISSYYQSKTWASYDHFIPGGIVDEYDKTDASLTFEPASGQWSVEGYVRNMFNTVNYASVVAASLPGGPAVGFIDPPRTYGIRVSAHF